MADDLKETDVDALRRENEALKKELEDSKGPGKKRHFWRSFFSWVCIILACLFAIAGTLSLWVETTTLNTNSFVKTIAPLIKQDAVAKAVSEESVKMLFETYNVPGEIKTGLEKLSKAIEQAAPRDLAIPDMNLSFIAEPISGALEGVAKTAAQKILQSKAFYSIWEKTLRTAHETMVNIVKGKKDAVVTSKGDTVILNLSELLNEVKKELVNAGLGFLDKVQIPEDFGQIELFTSAQIGSIKSLVSLLELLAWVLPFLALILFVAGVWLAVDHRKALLRSGIGLGIAMLLVLIVLKVAHGAFFNQIKETQILDAANVIWGSVLSGLKQGVWGLLVLGIVVALGAAVSGPSRWATWLREHVKAFFSGWRDRREGKKGKTAFSTFMDKYAWWFRIGGLVIAVVVLVFLPSISALAVIITVIVLAVYVGIIELVR